MNWQYWLTLVIAIAAGIPGYFALRKSEQSRIFFFEQDYINLYNRVVKTFNLINITYNSENINHALFLLRGIIYYTGKRDIPKSKVFKNLTFKLNKSEIWREVKIIKQSDDLNGNIRIENNELNFDIDLFKNGDYVYFEAIGEGDKHFLISHRIENVSPIQTIDPKKYIDYSGSISNGLFSIIFIVAMTFLIPFTLRTDNTAISAKYYIGQSLRQIPEDSAFLYYYYPSKQNSKGDSETPEHLVSLNSIVSKKRDSVANHTNLIKLALSPSTDVITLPENLYIKFFFFRLPLLLFTILEALMVLLFIKSVRDFIRTTMRRKRIKSILQITSAA